MAHEFVIHLARRPYNNAHHWAIAPGFLLSPYHIACCAPPPPRQASISDFFPGTMSRDREAERERELERQRERERRWAASTGESPASGAVLFGQGQPAGAGLLFFNLRTNDLA